MFENWRFLHRLTVAAVLAAAALAARAYTLIPMEFEQLARNADLVVVGRVAALESRFNDERTMILTHATIEVDETIAGDASETVEIAEYGGRVGDLAMLSPAQVVYEKGEQVLVFACRDALGLLRTCGAHQGRMGVTPAADGTPEAVGLMAGEIVQGSLPVIRARVLDARGRSK